MRVNSIIRNPIKPRSAQHLDEFETKQMPRLALLWSGLRHNSHHVFVWSGMVWYDTVWHGLVWYDMVWYGMIWHGMVWYDIVWHCHIQTSHPVWGRGGFLGAAQVSEPTKTLVAFVTDLCRSPPMRGPDFLELSLPKSRNTFSLEWQIRLHSSQSFWWCTTEVD